MADVLIDGFSTRLLFGSCSLTICLKTVTPPEVDSGGSIDISNMRITNRFRLRAPKYLISLNSMQVTAAWDPVVYNEAMIQATAVVGAIQLFSLIFPNGRGINFYGFVEKMTFGEMKEGEQPMVTITITPTLWNGTFSSDGCPVEYRPQYTTDGTPTGYRLCA